MSDSKGAAIDKLLDEIFISYSDPRPKLKAKQAILAILAQEVKKAVVAELTKVAKLRGSAKNPIHESTLIGDYLRNRLSQLGAKDE